MEEKSLESAPPARSKEHWVVLGLAGLVLLGFLVLGLFLVPDGRGFGTHEQLGLEPCYPMVAWNFPCPGCGVTTSVSHAARLELGTSLVVQPLGLVLSVGGLLFVVLALLGHLAGRDLWFELHRIDYSRWVPIGIGVALVAWVYKIGAVRGWF